jgi:hypothetical protein
MDRTRNSKIAPDTPAIVVLTRPNHSALEVVPGPIVAVAILQEGIRMNANIEIDPGLEIDLGLSKVSDSALTMLEGANGVANLPPEVFSKLLDALAEEHLRRFGVQKDSYGIRCECWGTGSAIAMMHPIATLIWEP